MIKKDRCEALLGFRVDDDSQQRRFIFPLRFHRRGLLIATNQSGNATRSTSTFPRYSMHLYIGDRDAAELLGCASRCITTYNSLKVGKYRKCD